MNPRLRSTVAAMRPYAPGKPIEELQRELGLTDVVKLASNENPLGPSPLGLHAAKTALERAHRYPDAGATMLKRGLAERLDLAPNAVVVGNGSDSLLQLLGLALLESPDDEVVTAAPSFVRYDAMARLLGCRLTKVPLDENMHFDLGALAAAVGPHTKLLFLASPNNPTGTYPSARGVRELLARVPETTLVVLDEAYHEYARDLNDYPDARALLGEGHSVVDLRTFSKAYGLAGLRVGYGFGPDWAIDAIERIRDPFLVSSIAQAAALAALDDHDHVSRTLELTRSGIARLREFLAGKGARTFESHANFVLADLGRPAQPVYEELLRRGVIVRPGAQLGVPTCLRISIGTEEEMQKFEAAFAAVWEGVGA